MIWYVLKDFEVIDVCVIVTAFIVIVLNLFYSCSSKANKVFATNDKEGASATSGSPATKYSYKTPAFTLFRFNTGNGMVITCDVNICFEGDDRCDVRLFKFLT